jgi:16S rRNA (guanine527-N7)-methyltransferase
LTLRQWSSAVNLVSRRSLEGGFWRHVVDSAQVAALLPSRGIALCDLGSGGGLPAIPISIIRRSAAFDDRTILVESDRRKAAFLRHVIGKLDIAAEVRDGRAETLPAQAADVITSRAMAPLVAMMPHLHRHLAPDGVALLHKGRGVGYEVEAARGEWAFCADEVPSVTAAEGVILRVAAVRRI